MSYLVLARKYRPQDFKSVTGQEHVTRTLSNAIKRDKVSHAHLFAGPRGVGKTSIARIFAKALNCEKGPTPSPCCDCQNCKEIAAGTSLAVREIDGASHNSVDNVRDLIDSFRSVPPPGSRYKIYIIDEVHMLSMAAFNALLKSLEEPPPHTVFILATTEAHKIPDTVISRCVRHDLRALSYDQIEKRLSEVTKTEKLEVEPEVLRMITRLADGSMRDAQSLLDRVQSFCEGKITASEASLVLGSVERALLTSLTEAILKRNCEAALQSVDEVFSRGADPGVFLREFVSFWRELLIAKFGGERGLNDLGLSKDEAASLLKLSGLVSPHDIQDLVHIAREGADSALRSVYTKYMLESVVVRMCTRVPVEDLGTLLDTLRSGGGATATTVTPSRAAQPARAQSAQVQTTAVASPAPKAAPAVTTPSASLSWEGFVQFATSSGGARILAENLKRLSPSKFAAGVLEAKGPKFFVASLEGKENAEKLKATLAAYSHVPAWTVKLTASDLEAEPGSLAHSENAERAKRKKDAEDNARNHPKVKSLQSVFPGSSIEDIKVKEKRL